jgi:hypothetical protein
MFAVLLLAVSLYGCGGGGGGGSGNGDDNPTDPLDPMDPIDDTVDISNPGVILYPGGTLAAA